MFAFFENAVEIFLLSFFSTLIYQQFIYDILVFFSIYVYTVIAFLNNCSMHGKFPSDACLKTNTGEKTFLKV